MCYHFFTYDLYSGPNATSLSISGLSPDIHMHLGQSINYHAPDNNAAIIDFVILFARFVYIVILLIGNVIYHQKFTFLQAIPFAVQTIQGRVQCCFKVISPPIAKKHFSRHIKELVHILFVNCHNIWYI